jgi:thiosulfate dehydrogenase [quinone] large subunit
VPPTQIGRVLLPLRAFLGFTFCFAGLQKLANPGFFNAANPSSIQAQLAAAARLSPIHALVASLAQVAIPLGIVIAFGELAVGIGTLLGLYAKLAAAGGIALSAMLFLTVSFHASPYYTGSDIVFVFAWTPLLMAGAGDVLSLDAVLGGRAAEVGALRAAEGRGRRAAGPSGEFDRRYVTTRAAAAGVAALGALVLGGLTAAIGRLAGGGSQPEALPALGAAPPTRDSSTPSGRTRHGRRAPAGGTRIGPAAEVPVGGAASFRDPGTGDPAIVVQPRRGTFLAFDAVCPHAGCIVSYEASQAMFVCPCHGSEFNGRTGAVIAGPAPRGLTPIRIAEGPGGELYAG